MTEMVVLVTGANGGIGQSLCQEFSDNGWRVVATDLSETEQISSEQFFSMDLNRICTDAEYGANCLSALNEMFPDGLDCLINNAAIQEVAAVDQLDASVWQRTLNVNLIAPFLLVRGLLQKMETARGNVINITSVHAQLTKPGFSAYASSKAGLVGLTRSLAVEIGARVRVNAIAPGAISTPMLIDGFKGSETDLTELAQFHPTNCIATPDELAQFVLHIAGNNSKFLNGSVIGFDGGIASRLHDPG